MNKPLFPACPACMSAPTFNIVRLWNPALPVLQCCDDHKPGSRAADQSRVDRFYRLTPVTPCADCGMVHTSEHECEPIHWRYDEKPKP